jgi:hypothetical protein
VLWAAVLSSGPGAMLSYWSAAELDGLADSSGSLVHVSIPGDRRIGRRTGVIVHVSRRAAEARHPVRLPPRTRIEETVLDFADTARTLDHAVGWITKALGRGLTTPAKLRDALGARARMRWRSELALLLSDDMKGVLSVLEYRFDRDVQCPHGLPEGERQDRSEQDGQSVYRDVTYRLYRLITELDGRLAHPPESRWRDIRRDNAAAAQGIITLRYGWQAITLSPCQVAAEIAEALSRAGYDGCHPCSPDCPVGLARAESQGA